MLGELVFLKKPAQKEAIQWEILETTQDVKGSELKGNNSKTRCFHG